MPGFGTDEIYPVGQFLFRVECDGLTQGFSEVTGFDYNIDVYEYREGQMVPAVMKCQGLKKYGNITLKRAVNVANGTELYDWLKMAWTKEVERKDLTITLVDNNGEDKASWMINGAWPVKYTAPDFNAMSSEAAMETLELAHEAMLRTK